MKFLIFTILFNVLNYTGAGQSFFLDNFPGGAVAYSVEKLTKNYTGPLVEIRRASDNATANFYPDNNNILSGQSLNDLGQTLNTWNSGTDGFCRTFYNQLQTGDLYQYTTTNQPKIFDSVTGLVLESATNRPAIGGPTSSYTFLDSSVISEISNINNITLLGTWKETVGSNSFGWPQLRILGTKTYYFLLQIFSINIGFVPNSLTTISALNYSICCTQSNNITIKNLINNSFNNQLTQSNGATNPAATIKIGLSGTANRADGQFSEFIVFNNSTNDPEKLINERNKFYNIF